MRFTSSVVGRCLRRGVLLSAFLVAAGCGGSKGSVSGKVTFKDQPLHGGQVILQAENGKTYSGSIDENGNYTITKVPPGTMKVSVRPIERPKIEAGQGPFRGGPPKGIGIPKGHEVPEGMKEAYENLNKPGQQAPKGFPEKYKDPKESGLTYTVTSGEQTYNIPLKK